jgi:hypothetical protein
VKSAWLAKFSWSWVTALNSQLCESGHAFHGPTSDGHEEASQLWEANYSQEMSLTEAVELCRRCHKIAPFCFFYGNTFASVIKLALQAAPGATVVQKHLLSTIGGHIVAGTATPEEEQQFRALLQKLD